MKSQANAQPEPAANTVYRFGVHLSEISPPIWRLIDVPSTYRFWDLHVAIQDAMGWLDYHLHEFSIISPDSGKPVKIGIRDADGGSDDVLPDSQCAVAGYFKTPGHKALYAYDFGDDWRHEIALSSVVPSEKGVTYPLCRDGERACPPEDCGGVSGYYRLLKILADPAHKEHQDTNAWLVHHPGPYFPYDPEDFDPDKVRFDDPRKRWKQAFESI